MSKISTLLSALRPVDVATPAGLARERQRRLVLTIVTSALTRLVTIVVPLVTTPMALRYLGNERYGLWMTVTSLVGMLAFADLGMGNGLLTLLSRGQGQEDTAGIRRHISSAYFVLGIMAAVLTAVFLLAWPFLPWGRFINATSHDLAIDSRRVALVCVAGFILNLPAGVVQRVQFGLQDGFRSSVWQLGANLLSMLFLFVAIWMKADIMILVACFALIPPLVAVLNSWVYFGFQRAQYRPAWRCVDTAAIAELLRMGSLYVLLSVLTTVSLYSDNVIVAQMLGIGAVTLFAIPARLATMLFSVIGLMCVPLWTANGEALARNDHAWVRKSTWRMVLLSVIVTFIFGVLLVTLGPAAIRIWLGTPLGVPRSLLSGFAVWSMLLAAAAPLFMVLNGAGNLKVQVKMFAVFLPIALAVKVALAGTYGVAGVPWGASVSYALVILPVLILAYRHTVRGDGGQSLTVSAAGPAL